MIGIDDLHEAIPVRPSSGPSPTLVLAPVWVMEDEYSYRLSANLMEGHGISVVIWKGVNAHFPPCMQISLGGVGSGPDGVEFTLTPGDPKRGPLTLDEFKAWVAKAVGTTNTHTIHKHDADGRDGRTP
jgi:hypothetical protein